MLNSPAHKVQNHHRGKKQDKLERGCPRPTQKSPYVEPNSGLIQRPITQSCWQNCHETEYSPSTASPHDRAKRGSWNHPNTRAMALSTGRFMQIVLKNPFCVFAKTLLRSLDNGFSVSQCVMSEFLCPPLLGIILLTNHWNGRGTLWKPVVGHLLSQRKTDNSFNFS